MMTRTASVSKALSALHKDVGATAALYSAESYPLVRPATAAVYTAFDGDDFYFTSAMAAHTSSHDRIAINPEACLGYKSAVDSLILKKNVLFFDVSLLEKADELWVYTRQSPMSPDWTRLAEGVIIEIIWYIRRCHDRRVMPRLSFVDMNAVSIGFDPDPVPVDISLNRLLKDVKFDAPEAWSVVSEYRDGGAKPVAVPIYALQDAKNSFWVREWLINEGYAPIVPTLAFDSSAPTRLRTLAEGWIWALLNADVVVEFSQMNGNHSHLLGYLRVLCTSHGIETKQVDWTRVRAPKAIQGADWPITSSERALLADTAASQPTEREALA